MDLLGSSGGIVGVPERNKLTYSNLLPDTDVSYSVEGSRIKELLVVRTKAAAVQAAKVSFSTVAEGVIGFESDLGGISFKKPSGEEVLSIPDGVAFDNADPPSQTPVKVVMRPSVEGQVLELVTDAVWLADSARVFPITVDPTTYIGKTSPASEDAYASNRCSTCNYNGAAQSDGAKIYNKAGYESDGYESYTFIKYDLTTLNGKGITSAKWWALPYDRRPTSGATDITLWRVHENWEDTTITWNSRPNHSEITYWDLQRIDQRIDTQVNAVNQWMNVDVTNWVWNWVGGDWSNQGFSIDTAGRTDDYLKFGASEMVFVGESHYLEVVYHELPSAAVAVGPADGTVANTATPTLSVSASTDPDGRPVRYWFRMATGKDGTTGQVLNSGWITQTSWQPPAGSLVDGATYYWKVFTSDDQGGYAKPSWVNKLKIDLRLGEQQSSVYDEVGPASVNLTNGNLFVRPSMPSYQTVGGSVGVSFAYNSKAQPQYGLTGTYYNGIKENGFTGQPVLVRRDSVINFDWGWGSPGPGVNVDDFLVRWTGYITVPFQASNWSFILFSDDGVRMWVNGGLCIDNWVDKSFGQSGQCGPLNLYANQMVEVVIEYFERNSPAAIRLDTCGPVCGTVPASWMSPEPLGVPQGWSMSASGHTGLAYSEVIKLSDSVVLIDPTGGTYEYRKTGTGSYQPVDQETGYLADEPGGGLILHASDGVIYRFNSQGRLIEARSAVDDLNPAAPRYNWDVQTGRLTSIVDPVSNRSISTRFAAVSTSSGDSACPSWVIGGSTVYAPAGMLCKITYWDGKVTNLYYDSGGQLARIENPGGEINDFGWESGAIRRVRDPLGADMVAAGRANDDTTRTLFEYVTPSFDAVKRVSRVTFPAPLAGAARPQHSYSYPSGLRTDMTIAGLSGNQRVVTVDSSGRIASDANAAGNTTRYAWDSHDRPRFVVDPTGIKTSTIYDQNHRPIESYGPAPESWFGQDDRPLASFVAVTPKSTTSYDEGMNGLVAAYFANRDVSGAAYYHETISGPINKNWGTGQPPNIPSGDNWSSRLTGEIRFPLSGNYTIHLDADDGVRAFIDDKAVIDDWRIAAATRSGTYSSNEPGSWRRFRIDHFEAGGGASLALRWTTPAGITEFVPGQHLRPAYGLVTSQVDPDGKKTVTGYGTRPELGLVKTTVVDPAGLNLTTTADHESTYYRRSLKDPPKGSQSRINYAFYGNTETGTHPCTGAAMGSQAGMLRQVNKPDPDGTGGLSAMSTSFVYDQAGRMVGRVVAADPAWSCWNYDARGRVTSEKDKAAKETTFSYTGSVRVTSFPDSAGTSRQTREELDMLGRLSKYTDEHGTITRRVYDQAGRLIQIHRQFSGRPEAPITEFAYDTASRIRSVTDKLTGTNRTTTNEYDAAGRLKKTTRPNGVVSDTAYDANTGRLDTIDHKKQTSISFWQYDHSPAGRVTHEEGGGRTRDYTYDGAARLSSVTEGANIRNYSYDANSNRCSTSTSCAAPTYQYHLDDRIKSSPLASSYTYDNRGNVTRATPTYTGSMRNRSWSFPFNALEEVTRTIGVGRAGTLSATLAWQTDITRSQTPTGSLNVAETATFNLPVEQESFISSKLTWAEGSGSQSSTGAVPVPGGSSATKEIDVLAPGDISASINWDGILKSHSATGNAQSGIPSDHPITVTAGGQISFSLSWPTATPNPNLDLLLLDPQGLVVSSSTQLSGNSESVNYNVAEQGSDFSHTFTLRVIAVGPGSDYQLSGSFPVTPTLDLILESADGDLLAQSSPEPGRRRRGLSYAAAAEGTYRLRISSADESVNAILDETHPVLSRAALTLKLRDPSGNLIKSSTSDSGTVDLSHQAIAPGKYDLEVRNESSSVAVPFFALPWSVTALHSEEVSGSLNPGQTATHSVTADEGGYIRSALNWTQGAGSAGETVTGNIGALAQLDRQLHATATGDITAELDWGSSVTSESWDRTVGTLSTWQTIISAGASGAINATLTWPGAVPNPDLDLYLIDADSGAQLAASEELTGNSETISYVVSGVSYPSEKDFLLRVRAKAGGSSFNLSSTWPVTANLNLELLNPSGQTIASSYSSVNKPETISAAAQPAGDYTVRVISADHSASYTLDSTYPVLKHATVALALKDQGGNTIVSTTSSSGEAEITGEVESAGNYVLEIVDQSTDLAIPSYTANTSSPSAEGAFMTLTLKDANGNIVATNVDPTANPKTVQASVQPGTYTLVAQSTAGWGDAVLTASYPGGPPKEEISYTGNDHAYYIDDGTFQITETLSPSGRVLRRRVVEIATSEVLEDVIYGYDSPGDSPSYSRPASSQTPVTTYVTGPNGLLIDVGGQASYPLDNGHGDLVGVTDGQGSFSGYPLADEWGQGVPPDSRLGWLGDHLRFNVGGALNFYRMGVRLYDPRLGRFLQVDPVEWGSANDYDYANQDPCNSYDLDGRRVTRKGVGRNVQRGKCPGVRTVTEGLAASARVISAYAAGFATGGSIAFVVTSFLVASGPVGWIVIGAAVLGGTLFALAEHKQVCRAQRRRGASR